MPLETTYHVRHYRRGELIRDCGTTVCAVPKQAIDRLAAEIIDHATWQYADEVDGSGFMVNTKNATERVTAEPEFPEEE